MKKLRSVKMDTVHSFHLKLSNFKRKICNVGYFRNQDLRVM